jgi:hypothetical protein
MRNKVIMYELRNIDGSIRCIVGIQQEEGGVLGVTEQVAMPSDPTVIGQWVLDQLASDEGASA